jgi:hypothetical protein
MILERMLLLCLFTVPFAFVSCKTRSKPKEQPTVVQDLDKQNKNEKKLQIWNGEEADTKYVGGMILYGVNAVNQNQILAQNQGSATAYLRPGCYLTAAHVLEGTPPPNLLRLNGFAAMYEAFTPALGNPPQLTDSQIRDREKLSLGHFIPLLQSKIHPLRAAELAAVNNDPLLAHGRDMAVFYTPPVGYKYKFKEGNNIIKPFIDEWETSQVQHIGPPLSADIPDGVFNIRGYGVRNPDALNQNIIDQGGVGNGDVDQRSGIERVGNVMFVGYNCPAMDNTCKIKAYIPNDVFAQTAVNLDSGGAISIQDKVSGIISGGQTLDNDPALKQAVINFYKDRDDHLPVTINSVTVGPNLYEAENNSFITSADYHKSTGQNVKLTCRPKPFIDHSPGIAQVVEVNGQIITSYEKFPNAPGGYVEAKNTDPMGEYKNTIKKCGKVNPNANPSNECGHDTWDNDKVNNSPLINMTIKAIPHPGYEFVAWQSTRGTQCLCQNRECNLTNEQVEKELPHTLIPHMRQVCLAIFKQIPPNNGGGGGGGIE